MTTTRPAPLRRRVTARLTGLAVAALLLVLLVAIPAGLWIFGGGNPLPTNLPGLDQAQDALLSPDDGSLFLDALLLVGWLAWASFALSVIIEAAAALRGVRAPRLPGLALQQRGAATLIALIALTFTAGQAGATTLAMPTTGPAPAPVSISAQLVDAPTQAHSAPTTTQPSAAPATVDYVVVTGDTPWAIAETLLGDGALYPQILDPNYGITQADGGALTEGGWLQPGWVLQVPDTTPTTTPADVAETTGADTITVQPGDTLTDLAGTHLDDPTQASAIFDSNVGLTQPDGRTLTDPDQIDVGWTLVLPTDTAPASPAEMPAEAPALAPAAEQAPAPAPAPAPGPEAVAPEAPTAAEQPPANPDATTADITAAADASDADSDDASPLSIRTAAGVGSLLAAGVLGLLAVRRRNQQRHRPPGAAIAMPTGPVADTEHELRSIAAPLDITLVDLALRTLAHHCATTGQPLPYVRAARLTPDQFELYLGEPAELPAPWTGTTDTTVWTLPHDLDATDLITDEQAAATPAPYPSLVTLGHDLDGAHVLLDLEEAGALALTGSTTATTEVITALALELATSTWADDLQVTIVGACRDLEQALRTGRVRHLSDTGAALTDLARRADLDRATLTEIGSPDLHHTRTDGTAPGLTNPEIVLLATDLTAEQRATLDTLLDALPRVAVAAVTTDGPPVGDWALTLSDIDDTAVLAPIGLTLRPQRVPAATYAHLIDQQLLAHPTPGVVADEPHLTDLPTTTPPDPNPAAAVPNGVTTTSPPAEDHQLDLVVHDIPTTTGSVDAATLPTDPDPAAASTGGEATVHQLHPAPHIQVLGRIHIEHMPTDIKVEGPDKLIELVTYIALVPGGNYVAIDEAITPGKPQSDNARNSRMSRARRMLGRAPDGRDYLPRHTPDGYRLHPAVTSDWQQWADLLPDGPTTATTANLEAALRLVRGRPFAGIKPRRYAWAERHMQDMISAVVDASWELGRRRLLEGRWHAAATAVAVGLDIEPGMERLARIQILAAHAGGNPDVTQTAIGRLLDVTDELGGDLEEVTEQLIHDLADTAAPGRHELVDAYAR